MSTLIAASAGARTPGTETQVIPPHPQPTQDSAQPEQNTAVDGIPFTSPVIKVDNDTGLALLVVRNTSTGQEIDQYPSRKAVEEYQRHQISDAAQVSAVSSNVAAAAPVQSVAAVADVKAAPAPVLTSAPVVASGAGPVGVSSGSGAKPTGR